jgi:hypothetical protein
MNKNKDDINKLLEDLKTEIKKIDLLCKQKSQLSEIKTYRISCPQITNKNLNKKYIGLLFDSESNQLIESESSCNNNDNLKSPFLKLKKCNYIINYCITIKIDNLDQNNFCFFSLGIRDDTLDDYVSGNKIRVIKGSKQKFNIKHNVCDDIIIIKDTIIYEADKNQELCLISNFGKKNKLLDNKSILKIYSL